MKQLMRMRVNVDDVIVKRDASLADPLYALAGPDIMTRLLILHGEASSCTSATSAIYSLLPGTLAVSSFAVAYAPRVTAAAVCELLRVVVEVGLCLVCEP